MTKIKENIPFVAIAKLLHPVAQPKPQYERALNL